jgi:FkbM family methyltransferase
MERHALRERWRSGALDKMAYVHGMRALHFDLEEYANFLRETRIKAITIADGEVTLESGWAPVRFYANFDDIGTPTFVSLAFGDYEPWEMRILLDLLEDARVFVDVGANIGWYSLHAAASFPDLRVLSLEPVAGNFAELSRNAELNGLSFEKLQLAVGEKPGTAEIQVPEGIAGASSLHLSRPYLGQHTERVEVTTLDDLAEQRQLQIDVLKVDVEGAELSVLRGGLSRIERDHPAVLAEMLRIHSAPFGYHPNDIITLMADLGYVCLTSANDKWRIFSHMDESTVETDFLFLHKDRHGEKLAAILGEVA